MKLERELADAVLEVSVRANQEIVEELKGDESMCQALLEIMEPEINKIVGEATSSGEFSAKEIVKYVPGVSIEEVMSLEKELTHS